jgi:hypothetical protein
MNPYDNKSGPKKTVYTREDHYSCYSSSKTYNDAIVKAKNDVVPLTNVKGDVVEWVDPWRK